MTAPAATPNHNAWTGSRNPTWADASPQILLGTLDHLQRHQPRLERRQPRTRVDQQLKVVHDYDEALPTPAPCSWNFFVSNDESWTIEEQSATAADCWCPKGG